MCRHSLLIKAIAAVIFASAIALLWGGRNTAPAPERFSISVPTEVTPEIVAMRACIEGVAHPSEKILSFGQQLSGCDDWVATDTDTSIEHRLRDRARFLDFEGTTGRHRDMALQDYTTLVNRGHVTPHLLERRAMLNIFHRGDFQAGLDDVERGLTMLEQGGEFDYVSDKTANLLILRASARLAMVYSQHDDALLVQAEQDVAAVFERSPKNKRAMKLKGFIEDYHRARAIAADKVIQKG
jgi:hypothetical protein